MNASEAKRIDRTLGKSNKRLSSRSMSTLSSPKATVKSKKGILEKLGLIVLVLLIFILLMTTIFDSTKPNENKGEIHRERTAMAALLYKFKDSITDEDGNIKMPFVQYIPGTGSEFLGTGGGATVPFIGANLGDNASDVLANTNLNDLEMKMVSQYSAIIENASKEAGIPSWVLYLISYFEGHTIRLPVIVGSPGFSTAEFGQTRNGKVIDYYTYGKKEAEEDGRLGLNDDHRGPFQLRESEITTKRDFSGDGVADIYNYADAALMAAYHAKNKSNYLRTYFKDHNISDDVFWMLVAGANNAGQGGFRARYPDDSYGVLIDQMNTVINSPLNKSIGEGYYERKQSEKGRGQVYQLLDTLGWKVDADTRARDWNANVTWTQPELIMSEMSDYWPGNQYTGKREYQKTLPNRNPSSGTGEFAAFEYDGKKDFMMNNRQNIEYILSSYAVGTMMRDTLYKLTGGQVTQAEYSPVALALRDGTMTLDTIRENSNMYSPYIKSGIEFLLENKDLGLKVGQKKVLYNWEIEQINNGVEYDDIKKDSNAVNKEGSLGEVGYKGSFPIFVQGTNMNYISRLSWKFQGRNTTLGSSGCSLYALTSLIHGAGYGDKPIPNYPDTLPTFENLTKILDNGPIVSNHVKNILGYKVSVLPTVNNGDFENIWNNLANGVPYVVNVNSKSVTAYDEYLNPKITKFTTGGHFIILAGGYELNNMRMVEVIQSTGSNAGLKEIDQNRVAFDFDELVSKGVIRSSFGSAVPAYTITGGSSLPPPRYLAKDYTAPTRVEVNHKDSIEIETTTEDIVIDLYTIQ